MTTGTGGSGGARNADLYRELFAQVPAIVAVLRGPTHICEYVNDAYTRQLGHKDTIGKPIRQSWSDLKEQKFFDLLDRVYATGVAYADNEVVARFDPKGDGTLVEAYFNFVYQPMRDASGTVDGLFVCAVDVTELVTAKQNAERLSRAHQEDKAWLTGILAGIADAVIATDAEDRVSLMNPVAQALTGWREEEARGLPLSRVFHVVHEHTRRKLESPVEQVRREGGVVRSIDHCVLVRRNGTEVMIEQSVAPLVTEEVRAASTVVVFRDITQRKLAERAARQREEHFRALLVSTSEGIWGQDVDGRCTFANPACVTLLGYESADQLLGQNMHALVHDHSEGPVPRREACRLDEALRTGESTVVNDDVFRRRDGVRFAVQVRSSPLMRDGQVEGAVVTFEDISDRKAADERLRQLTRILEESTDFIAMARPDTTGFYVNPAGRRLVGVDVEQRAESMRLADHIAPGSIAEANRIIAEALQKGRAAGEIKLRHLKTGEEIPIWWPIFVIRDDKTRAPLFLATVARDLREQKRAEAERAALVTGLRERADFEQQLIGIVSHDLRNPLNAMLLSARALLRRGDLGERTVKAVSLIQSAGDRAVRLVKDLLDFTQARLGRGLPVDRAHVDLHWLVRQVADEVQASSPERPLEVTTSGNCEGEWDRDRLSQVVANLAANALQYGTPGTSIKLTTRGLEGSVEMEVENQGPPIPAEDLGRLFEPMQRASSKGTMSTRSVGLGLYIVKHIVDAHGGTIDVRSSPTAGTAFTVRLPRHHRM